MKFYYFSLPVPFNMHTSLPIPCLYLLVFIIEILVPGSSDFPLPVPFNFYTLLPVPFNVYVLLPVPFNVYVPLPVP